MDQSEIIDSLRCLHDLSKTMNSSLSPADVEAAILDKTAELMGSERVVILLLDGPNNALAVHRARGFDESQVKGLRFENIRSFDHCIVHKGTVITMRDVLSDADLRYCQSAAQPLLEMVFAPLEIKGAAYGLLGASGAADDISPIDLEMFCLLASQAAVAMENARIYTRLNETFLHTTEALAEAINSRDPYTGGHTRRVSDYASMIADSIKMAAKAKQSLRIAAMLHDIGKIGIDDRILRKASRLTAQESALMNAHPEIGARILGHVDDMADVIAGIRHHHERFDGRGYPAGLAGEAIPVAARIIAIADAYDALTTDRPYRGASSPAQALLQLGRDAGSQFDPTLLTVFTGIIAAKTARQDSDTGLRKAWE